MLEPWNQRSDGHPDIVVTNEDMAFIAAARTALPKLIAIAEAARKVVRLDRPVRLDTEGCRAGLEQLSINIKSLDAALRSLEE